MLNNIVVSIDELRSNLADIVNRVTYANHKVMVRKYNRNTAIIISLDEYEKLVDPTKRLSSTEWKDKVKKLDNIRIKIPKVNPQKLDQAIADAVYQVRTDNKKTDQ